MTRRSTGDHDNPTNFESQPMRHHKIATIALALAGFTASATASTISYTLTDILAPTNQYQVANTGQNFSGTGFVGVYSFNEFGHLMGLEGGFSFTNMQVDIAALSGAAIQSATLSFKALEHYGTGTVSITGYDSNGALGYATTAPNAAYGLAGGALVAGANQSYDVTALVQAAANAGEDWLGLFMMNTENTYNWTYTFTGWGGGYTADRAEMRLAVNFANQVPEPGSLALTGLALLALAVPALRRRQRG